MTTCALSWPLDKAGKAKAADMARHHAMRRYPGMFDGTAGNRYINKREGPTPDKENKQWPRDPQSETAT